MMKNGMLDLPVEDVEGYSIHVLTSLFSYKSKKNLLANSSRAILGDKMFDR